VTGPTTVTLGDLVSRYIEGRSMAGRSTANIASTLGGFVAFVGDISPAEVTSADVLSWLAQDGLTPTTAKGYLSILRVFVSWLTAQGIRTAMLADPALAPARRARRPPAAVDRDFREHLLRAGLSSRSALGYIRAIQRVESWCVANGAELGSISAQRLTEYLATQPPSWSNRKMIRSSLTHYWSYTGRLNPPLGVLKLPRRPRMVCRALEPADAALLAKVARQRHDKMGLAVLLALYQGLRRAEIAGLRWDGFRDGQLTLTGKGGYSDTIPVHPVVVEALGDLERGTSPYLFPGVHGGGSNPTTIWGWVRTVAADAGIGAIPPHRLRHSCLSTANDGTGDLRAVQTFARHASPMTTAGYTRTSGKRLAAVLKALDYEGLYLDDDEAKAAQVEALVGQLAALIGNPAP